MKNLILNTIDNLQQLSCDVAGRQFIANFFGLIYKLIE